MCISKRKGPRSNPADSITSSNLGGAQRRFGGGRGSSISEVLKIAVSSLLISRDVSLHRFGKPLARLNFSEIYKNSFFTSLLSG